MSNQCKDCRHWVITQTGYCTPQHIDSVDGDDDCPLWKKKHLPLDDDLVGEIDEQLVQKLLSIGLEYQAKHGLQYEYEEHQQAKAEIRKLLQGRGE